MASEIRADGWLAAGPAEGPGLATIPRMAGSAAVERWFASTRPPSEPALRRVRDIILGADPSMRERIQYGITFSSTKSGDFAAFVRYSEPGVNLRLMRGRRLRGRYPHLEGTTVKRMRLADATEATARAGELRSIVKEWCALGDAATAPKAAARG